ncbi:Hypothetical predicted protein [Olea europaea subsp. europaea]|uniref:Uncharacterized protein n=1 Tax=Olea europaea subsp. europaea TaxID=158383 RepID=A0A8S0V1T4_OLEEU|nr:Hypothetical predicted protein [Olea europaea subsp. europaea]
MVKTKRTAYPVLSPSTYRTSQSRNSDSKEDETNNVSRQQCSADKKNRVNERSSNIASNGIHQIESSVPLKSNLKKAAAATGTRKVSWSDSHGKDIADVQEFESSVIEEEELRGVRNSCTCIIQ